MNFWIFAVALLAIPAAIISWPLFAGSSRDRFIGMTVLLLMPLAGLIMYQNIGTPAAINLPAATARQATDSQAPHSSQQPQMVEMIGKLQQRMTDNPDDPEGWLILGRSLKTMQRYDEAETALANANRLVPDNPLIMVELAETRLFKSGKPEISAESRQLIEAALAIDPLQQKALWLLGMAAAQDGDEAYAVEIWQRLLTQLDPASGAAQSVSQQIEMAQGRLGPPAAQAAASVSQAAASGLEIPVTISIADDLNGAIPNNAVLFVFIHPAGTRGMPLAVKRLAAQGFPLSLSFSDTDLLRPETSLESFEQLDISARISMSGVANSASGDYQANLVTLDTNSVDAIALHLDQRVP
jgi:cytochrome c-type biogenesis protein CcmH